MGEVIALAVEWLTKTNFYNNRIFSLSQEIHLIQNAFLLNSPLLVDTFLLLSGFLFAHLLMVELEKRHGNVNFLVVFLGRYIRLTPAYLAVIALYSTWLPKLGSGPLWDSRMGLEQERCQSSWWINLLYVNNYIGTDKIVSHSGNIQSLPRNLLGFMSAVHVPVLVFGCWHSAVCPGTAGSVPAVAMEQTWFVLAGFLDSRVDYRTAPHYHYPGHGSIVFAVRRVSIDKY